jgi:type IX secretion system PorP/SprF family membrane protein
MSRPNFENIDRWLYEFTEGNLSADQESYLLDFLELHPELMPELKAWKSAKVKAPIQEPFATQHLIKATPFLLRPFALVSIAFLAILLTWFGIEMIPVTPLYVQAEIDTEIIKTEVEEDDVFIDQLLAMSLIEKQNISEKNNNHENNLNEIAFVENQTSTTNDFSIAKYIAKTKSTRNSDIQLNNQVYTTEKTEISELIENRNWEDQSELETEQDYAYNLAHQSIQSEDLESISNYLNHKDEVNTQFSSEKDLAVQRKNSSSSSSASKSTLAKSLKSTFRKIRRMADYPIGLQNTKNPHFHVPMMTGYKANIAMVGSAPGNRIQATSRMQWLNESNSQLMNSLSWDGYIYAIRGGFGIDVNYDNYQNNELNNYSAAITYSPKFSISKKVSFEPAIRFKMGVINLDQNSNSIGNTIELDRENIIPLFKEEQQANGQQLWYRDVGLGFMINTEWFYAGFDADNIGRHNNNFYSGDLNKEYKSNIHYTAVLGTEYVSKTKETRISGYGLYQNYGELDELWMGTNFQYKWMQIGVAASSDLNVAGSFGTVFKKFSFHYNVDYTKSRLLDKQILSHQVTMKILLKPSRYVAKFLKL